METQQLRDLNVKSIMSTQLIFVNENDLMSQVNEKFDSNDIHHIPVINDKGHLAGVISKNDMQLLKDWGSSLNLKSSEIKNEQLMSSKLASDIMSKDVMSVNPDVSLGFCADVFRENLFHCLPVVDDGKLIGIVTTYDLLNAAYNSTLSLI